MENREVQLHIRLDRVHLNSSRDGKMVVGCASGVSQLPSDVAPILMSTKTVLITDGKLVNNEKYRWPLMSASSSVVIGSLLDFWWLLYILIMCVIN